MTDKEGARWSWIAMIAALGFHAINGLFVALMVRFPAPLDELEHLSYARWMESAPRLFPRFEDMRLLDPADPTGMHFISVGNYLSHPSLYYLLMGWIDWASGGSILDLRLMNMGLSLCGVAIILTAGFRVLRDCGERTIFAVMLVLFPKLGVVAGLINNDNAGLLAAGIAFLALLEWQRLRSIRNAIMLGFGIALCGWVKLTVFLMAGFGVLIAEGLWLWARNKKSARPNLGAYAVIVIGFVVAALPSLASLAAYGRAVYHLAPYYVPPAQRAPLSFAEYAVIFLRGMAIKWPAFEPSNLMQQLGFYFALGLAVAVVIVGLRRMQRMRIHQDQNIDAAWRTACAMIMAIVPVLLLHLYFGWHMFLEDGILDAGQIRYYYGVWPGIALGLALLWRNDPGQSRIRLMIIATILFLISSSLIPLSIARLISGQAAI